MLTMLRSEKIAGSILVRDVGVDFFPTKRYAIRLTWIIEGIKILQSRDCFVDRSFGSPDSLVAAVKESAVSAYIVYSCI